MVKLNNDHENQKKKLVASFIQKAEPICAFMCSFVKLKERESAESTAFLFARKGSFYCC